jgi:hypothetical protein
MTNRMRNHRRWNRSLNSFVSELLGLYKTLRRHDRPTTVHMKSQEKSKHSDSAPRTGQAPARRSMTASGRQNCMMIHSRLSGHRPRSLIVMHHWCMYDCRLSLVVGCRYAVNHNSFRLVGYFVSAWGAQHACTQLSWLVHCLLSAYNALDDECIRPKIKRPSPCYVAPPWPCHGFFYWCTLRH